MNETCDSASKLADLEDSIVYYVLHRAVDRFFETHKRYPGIVAHLFWLQKRNMSSHGGYIRKLGYHNHEVETDVGLLKKCVTSLLSEWQIPQSVPLDDHVHEMCV